MAKKYRRGYKDLRNDLNYCRKVVHDTLKEGKKEKKNELDIEISMSDINC
jgi:hypothetical protein